MVIYFEKRTPRFPYHESTVPRNGGGNLSIHFCVDGETVETVLRTIISVNRLSIYGAVAEMCEKCDSCHDDRTLRPVVAGQFNPVCAKCDEDTHTPLTDDLLQRF